MPPVISKPSPKKINLKYWPVYENIHRARYGDEENKKVPSAQDGLDDSEEDVRKEAAGSDPFGSDVEDFRNEEPEIKDHHCGSSRCHSCCHCSCSSNRFDFDFSDTEDVRKECSDDEGTGEPNDVSSASLHCEQDHKPCGNYQRLLAQKGSLNRNINRGKKTSVKRLQDKVLEDIVKKCKQCTVIKACCCGIHYPMVKQIREELYQEGVTNNKTRREWRYNSILGFYEEWLKNKGKNDDSKLTKLKYWLMDHTKTLHSESKKIYVCRECYCRVTGISNGTLLETWKAIVKEKQRSVPDVFASKSEGKTQEWLYVQSWIEMYINGLCCFSPDQKKHELPSANTRKFMYEKFKTDWDDGVLSGDYIRKHFGRMKAEDREQNPNKCPGYEYFTKVWKEEFDEYITIPRHCKRFAMCNWCAELKNRIVREKDREKRLYWKSQLYKHYEWVTLQRRKYYKHRKKAIEMPER